MKLQFAFAFILLVIQLAFSAEKEALPPLTDKLTTPEQIEEKDLEGDTKKSMPFNIYAKVKTSVSNVLYRELSFGELFPVNAKQEITIKTTEKNPLGVSGKFSIYADKAQVISTHFVNDSLILTDGKNEIKVKDFTLGHEGKETGAYLVPAFKDNTSTFYIGGTIVLKPDQTPGMYKGQKTLVIQME